MITIDQLKQFREEINKYWTFDDNQQHTHTWHDKQEFLSRLDAIIEAGENDEWVSVNDQLPEDNNKSNQMIRIIISNPFGSQEAYFNPLIKTFLTLGYTEIRNVTHWMPLPQPPKK